MKRLIIASVVSGFLYMGSVLPAQAGVPSEGIGAVIVVALLIFKPFKKSGQKAEKKDKKKSEKKEKKAEKK